MTTAQSIRNDLVYFRRNYALEKKSLDLLISKLYSLSDQISKASDQVLLLEVGASLRLFGNAETILQKAVDLSLHLGHQVIGRFAATPHIAVALAYSNTDNLSKVLITDSSLDLAGIPGKIIRQLPDMGIDTLEDLVNLPFDELGKRLNANVVRYLNELTGKTPDLRKSITPDHRFIEEIYCLQPIKNKLELHQYPDSPIQVLLKQLHHWLRINQLGCEMLNWEFEAYKTDKISHYMRSSDADKKVYVTTKFSAPQQSTEILLKMTRLCLEQQVLPEEVLTIRLKVNRVTSWEDEVHSLFKSLGAFEVTKNNCELDTYLLDEINSRLGEGACRGIEDTSSITPEASWRFVESHLINEYRKNKNTCESPMYKKRPLWLTDPPTPIRRNAITLIDGPEKIKSQWWSEYIDRDYYVARKKNGAECWVFTNTKNHWYLHGYF
ncbi:hypothetical protein OAL14_00215 [Gammaproteobacteria bacterium]|nr:hypothetical protein [Gammaproteobacteria bacterium]